MGIQKIDVLSTDMKLKDLIPFIEQGDEILLMKGEQLLTRIPPEEAQPVQRIADLHPGAMIASDDFDSPLPDEFWLGGNP